MPAAEPIIPGTGISNTPNKLNPIAKTRQAITRLNRVCWNSPPQERSPVVDSPSRVPTAKVAKAKKTADATLDSAALTQQVQLFYGQEGRYPKDLNELVTEKYLKSLPTPPHGTKLEYNAANGQVKVVKE